MTLPTTWDGAVAMIGSLIADPLLGLGLATVVVILVLGGALTWALVRFASGVRR